MGKMDDTKAGGAQVRDQHACSCICLQKISLKILKQFNKHLLCAFCVWQYIGASGNAVIKDKNLFHSSS